MFAMCKRDRVLPGTIGGSYSKLIGFSLHLFEMLSFPLDAGGFPFGELAW